MQRRRLAPPYTPPPQDALKVLHCQADFIVVSKPHGLLSVPGLGENKDICVESYMKDRFGTVYIVHRLDMDTSGLMVLARSTQARRALARAFQNRTIVKHYQALVEGCPASESGLIDRPVARYSRQRPLRHLEAGGLAAITHWHCVSRSTENQLSRMNLFPKTGRSHQLRLHMQAIGHPILGDPFYGDPRRYKRLALHATYLAFSLSQNEGLQSFSEPAPF